MKVGRCERCKRQSDCGYRQPGTWVVDCELFDEGPRSGEPSLLREYLTPMDNESTGTAPDTKHLPMSPVTKRRKTR
jgi:hypothetical protein